MATEYEIKTPDVPTEPAETAEVSLGQPEDPKNRVEISLGQPEDPSTQLEIGADFGGIKDSSTNVDVVLNSAKDPKTA